MLDISKFNKFFVANWKLHGSITFVDEYLSKITSKHNNSDCVVICPPFTFINKIKLNNLFIGAQDCSAYSEGAYTGEISAKIIKNMGCSFCIVGHSERRSLFNDNDDLISKKISQCINESIIPILCIGETINQKNNNLTQEVLTEQLKKNLPKEANNRNVILAYEPLWAIGTGIVPKLSEIVNIHLFIKNDIINTKEYKILYGGSVNKSNSKDILSQKGVDGLLVGGASLKINEFNTIIEN